MTDEQFSDLRNLISEIRRSAPSLADIARLNEVTSGYKRSHAYIIETEDGSNLITIGWFDLKNCTSSLLRDLVSMEAISGSILRFRTALGLPSFARIESAERVGANIRLSLGVPVYAIAGDDVCIEWQ